MKALSLRILGLALCAGLSLACGSDVCERSNKAVSGKTGDCQDQTLQGLGSSCSSAQSKCDSKILDEMASCFEKLPVCSSADEASWVSARSGCYAKADALSEECKTALFGGVIPGTEDAGVDAGQPGPQPDLDGGGAVDLVVVADENDFAAAWTKLQPGTVFHWELYSNNALGLAYPTELISDPNRLYFTVPDAGLGSRRSFFVLGAQADGGIAYGVPVDPNAGDAGSVQCTVNSDCPQLDRVCDIGQCKTLSCQNSNTCPAGYVCENQNTFLCNRQYNSDGGTVVAPKDAGPAELPKPFLSELGEATTQASSFHQSNVSEFPADEDPDMVAIDSARQVVTVQQYGQIFAHVTEDRGRTWRVTAVDPLGQHARVTWNPDSRTIFVCYAAGQGIRVRSSDDLGKTWSSTVAEIALPAPDDGGLAQPVTDCDIAPWRDGGAMVTALMVDHISVFTISSGLAVGTEEQAFVNEPNTSGVLTTVFNAQRPSIATVPSEFIVHVGFTGTRNLTGGGTDSDVYGVYRDPARTGGNFSNRIRISGGAVGAQGQPLDQDRVVIATEPGTGRAFAAYQSDESGTTGGIYSSIYVSLFTRTGNGTWTWITGSDLSVFARDNVGNYLVMADRPASGAIWDAISPSVTRVGNGKLFLAFAAGPSGSPKSPYVVGISFEQPSPITTAAKGWFLVPALKASTTPIVDLGNTPKLIGPVISGDQQISSYLTWIEGVGAGATLPNRPIIVTRP